MGLIVALCLDVHTTVTRLLDVTSPQYRLGSKAKLS